MIDDWRVPPVDDDPACSERGLRHPVLLQEEYEAWDDLMAEHGLDSLEARRARRWLTKVPEPVSGSEAVSDDERAQ